nr:hypothetical protein Iba_chr06eCG3480 [Ipomoea batatas]
MIQNQAYILHGNDAVFYTTQKKKGDDDEDEDDEPLGIFQVQIVVQILSPKKLTILPTAPFSPPSPSSSPLLSSPQRCSAEAEAPLVKLASAFVFASPAAAAVLIGVDDFVDELPVRRGVPPHPVAHVAAEAVAVEAGRVAGAAACGGPGFSTRPGVSGRAGD